MSLRERLLAASRKASEVLNDLDVRKRVAEGHRSRVDPVALAEETGVVVMVKDLEKLLGAFLREEQPGILLNSERPVGMVHMTCAHELGHCYLGHLTTADEHIDYGEKSDIREQEANQFAYSLLVPRWLVVHAVSAKGWTAADLQKPEVVYQLSLRLGVSYTAMVWALLRLKFLRPVMAATLAKRPPKALKEAALPPGVPTPPNADVWVLDPRDKDWVIEPRASDFFVVQLPSHSTAGYLWSSEQVAGEGFTLRPVLIDSRQRVRGSDPPLVGGRQWDSYVLDGTHDARALRDCHIHLRETQPWEKSAEANNEFDLALEFEQLKKGLSEGTRKRAIEL